MQTTSLYPRYAESPLVEALSDSPAVLVHGPRQCGKTTLARMVGDSIGYNYINFDDDVARAAANADPAGFIAGLSERAILDEVQRVPSIFTALKQGDRPQTHSRAVPTYRFFPSPPPAVAGGLFIRTYGNPASAPTLSE